MKDSNEESKRINLKYGWSFYMEVAEYCRDQGMFKFSQETGLVDSFTWKRPLLLEALSKTFKKEITVGHLKPIMDNYNNHLKHLDKYTQHGVSVEENKLVAKIEELKTALQTQASFRTKLEDQISVLKGELEAKEKVSPDVKQLREDVNKLNIDNKRLNQSVMEFMANNIKVHNALEIIMAQTQHGLSHTKIKRTVHLPEKKA